jgi:hypothetical protein
LKLAVALMTRRTMWGSSLVRNAVNWTRGGGGSRRRPMSGALGTGNGPTEAGRYR